MPIILASAPGLAFIGLVMLTIGVIGLMIRPNLRGDIFRVFATGLVVTCIGGAPLVLGGMHGAAFADDGKSASPMQQVMLSGMSSQIIYD